MPDYMSLAEELIGSVPKPVFGGHVVIIRERKLKCVPGKSAMPGDKPVHFLTARQVNNGLTSRGWECLLNSLGKVKKEFDL